MSTLDNHTIIYDDECPMCDIYTRAFVKKGLLDSSGRKGFRELSLKEWNELDRSRASNEIPLRNNKTGEFTYGVDSLFKILASRFPWMSHVFANRIFVGFIKRFYSFISYNRKAIVPGSSFEADNFCAPTFNLKYRWLYILFCWIVTAFTLNAYADLLTDFIGNSSFIQEASIAAGQVFFQGAFVYFLRRERTVYYLGNLMTISLMGSLLLIPVICLSYFLQLPTISYLVYFGGVATVMLLEHMRRVKILQVSGLLTVSWVLYRVLVLFLVL